jgi:hypothetical protein
MDKFSTDTEKVFGIYNIAAGNNDNWEKDAKRIKLVLRNE